MKNKAYKTISNLIKSKEKLVKVYSHPRSGTHFLEAFLAQNFYQNKNLSIREITWGHWSNRQVKKEGNPYGKLFGNHYFAKYNTDATHKIYILRDGRAVAYSIWKTPNFLNNSFKEMTFKEYLRTPIDWHGTPAHKVDKPKYTIFEHWAQHVSSWKELAVSTPQILLINYEDLVNQPYNVYKTIHAKFFSNTVLLKPEQFITIDKPLGLLPNAGKIDVWKKAFDEKDIDYYNTILLRDN